MPALHLYSEGHYPMHLKCHWQYYEHVKGYKELMTMLFGGKQGLAWGLHKQISSWDIRDFDNEPYFVEVKVVLQGLY